MRAGREAPAVTAALGVIGQQDALLSGVVSVDADGRPAQGSPPWPAVVTGAAGRPPGIEIELGQVTFCDVAFLRSVIAAERRCARDNLAVRVRTSRAVRKTARLAGLRLRSRPVRQVKYPTAAAQMPWA